MTVSRLVDQAKVFIISDVENEGMAIYNKEILDLLKVQSFELVDSDKPKSTWVGIRMVLEGGVKCVDSVATVWQESDAATRKAIFTLGTTTVEKMVKGVKKNVKVPDGTFTIKAAAKFSFQRVKIPGSKYSKVTIAL